MLLQIIQFWKMDIQCKKCDKYSTNNNLSCNIDQEYYPAINKPASHCYKKTTIKQENVLLQLYDEETQQMFRK